MGKSSVSLSIASAMIVVVGAYASCVINPSYLCHLVGLGPRARSWQCSRRSRKAKVAAGGIIISKRSEIETGPACAPASSSREEVEWRACRVIWPFGWTAAAWPWNGRLAFTKLGGHFRPASAIPPPAILRLRFYALSGQGSIRLPPQA